MRMERLRTLWFGPMMFTAFLSGFFAANASAGPPQFGARINRGSVENSAIREASGLVASRKNPGVLWTHNDAGNSNRLYALNSQGRTLGSYSLRSELGGITNRGGGHFSLDGRVLRLRDAPASRTSVEEGARNPQPEHCCFHHHRERTPHDCRRLSRWHH